VYAVSFKNPTPESAEVRGAFPRSGFPLQAVKPGKILIRRMRLGIVLDAFQFLRHCHCTENPEKSGA
jgi:hypothetical protein